MRKVFCLSLVFILCQVIACTAPGASTTTSSAKTQTLLPPTPPTAAKTMETADGLSITDAGIDFDKTHKCPSIYNSKTSDVTLEGKQKTGYTITTSCKDTGETHSYVFSNITYNQFGQRDSYKLDLSCSKTGKSHSITVSRITYSSGWDVLSYTATIGGKDYQYNR